MAEPTVERLDFIEGLRGIAIGLVIVFHATIWGGLHGRPAKFLWYGHAIVDLFFVISGFCLLWPVLRRGEVGVLAPARFYARRFLRIAPPYFVAVALVVVVSALMWQYGGQTWWTQPMQSVFPAGAGDLAGNVATHVSFTHGLFPSYDRSLDGAYWSLSTEWQFYLVLPLLIIAVRRFGLGRGVGLMVGISVVYALAIQKVDPYLVHRMPVAGDNILFRLVEFGAGMFAAGLVSARRRLPLIVPGTITAIAAGLYLDHWGPAVATPFAWAAAFAGLTLCCCWLPAARSVAEWPPFRALGRISYSAYLTHGIVLMAMAIPLTAVHTPRGLRLALLVLVGPPLAVGAAVIFYRLFERPAIGWARAVRGVRRRPANEIVETPALGLPSHSGHSDRRAHRGA